MYRRLFSLTMIGILSGSWASRSEAHVKWFSSFDIAGPPVEIDTAFNQDFLALFALSATLLLMGSLIAAAPAGRVLLKGIDRISAPLELNGDLLIRAACGFFFVSLWNLGGIILTPELKTGAHWISWFQLALAATLLWRQTLPLTAAGIVILYAIALANYGPFHLLDYPVFLGLAAYFALTGFDMKPFGWRPIDILRVMAAVTLMWASVEKWAYPQWSHPIIEATPAMTLGFSREVFMQAAGVIEFALSFALLLGPLARRVSALVLLSFFISAIGPFGKIDAIGHAPIIAAIVAIIGDSSPAGAMIRFDMRSFTSTARGSALVLGSYGSLLVAFVSAYYVLHANVYGPLPEALCLCRSHQPEHTALQSEAAPSQPARTGPLCRAYLASKDLLVRIGSPQRSAQAGSGVQTFALAGTGDVCAGASAVTPAK